MQPNDLYLWGMADWSVHTDTKNEGAGKCLDFPLYLPLRTPLTEVSQIACGAKFSLFLTKSGHVWGFGNNSVGQLGVPTTTATIVEYPVQLPMLTEQPIVQVACGLYHSLALSTEGNVYSTGENSQKQLGNYHREFRAKWLPVPIDDGTANVRAIACGAESSYAVSVSGKVYSWGSMKKGCLGHGMDYAQVENENDISTVAKPQLVEALYEKGVTVEKIAAGLCHFLVLTTAGDVYTCGDGTFGKLGLGSLETQWEPAKVTFPFRKNPERATNVYAGGDVSFVLRECAVLGTMVYMMGRLGSDWDGFQTPQLVMDICGRGVTRVECGKHHYVALCRGGQVYSWGKNSKCSANGIVGEVKNKVATPHQLTLFEGYHVGAVGCGSHHTIVAVTSAADSKRFPKEISIPLIGRYAFNAIQKAGKEKVRFETICHEYRLRFLGEAEGTAYNVKLPPMEEEALEAKQYRKLGSHALDTGSKVKVWMQNVYAWGTVIRRTENELNPKRPTFYVRWLREDWMDESIELCSDDETEEPSNLDRWQHGWVHE